MISINISTLSKQTAAWHLFFIGYKFIKMDLISFQIHKNKLLKKIDEMCFSFHSILKTRRNLAISALPQFDQWVNTQIWKYERSNVKLKKKKIKHNCIAIDTIHSSTCRTLRTVEKNNLSYLVLHIVQE